MNQNAIYNPHSKPVDELPIIYGFNNGGQTGFFDACLISADGHILGGHICSHEGFMRGDLGILEGSRPDRHERFQSHYPDGYRMEFVCYEAVGSNTGLQDAIRKLNEREPAEQPAVLKCS